MTHNRRRRGFVLIELLLALSLLAAVTVPVYMATSTYLNANNATERTIRLQTEANTILETVEKAVRNSDAVEDLQGDVLLHAIPVDGNNPRRSDWLTVTELGLSAGTFTHDAPQIRYGSRTLSEHLETLEVALLFGAEQSGSVHLTNDAEDITGIAVRLGLAERNTDLTVSRDFLLRTLALPEADSTVPEGNLMFGDDESFVWQNGYPLNFNVFLHNLNRNLKAKQSQLIIFLEPGITFNEDGTRVIEADTPAVSIQYLSNNGVPDNKNKVSVHVGRYTPSAKKKTLSDWSESIDTKNDELAWHEDEYLNVRIVINESNYYSVELGIVHQTGFETILSYTTPYQASGENVYGLYLGAGFGNNHPGDLKTDNDVAVEDTDPDATGILEIEHIY